MFQIKFPLMVVLACFLNRSAAQNNIGVPDIVSYANQKYGAGTQNWDIRQDNKGLVYFANNEGLLSFDGTYWKLYPLPNKTIVRSVEIGPDNNIYVGGQDEIGYFSPDRSGKLVYTSLKEKIPENNRTFADIWDIYSYNNYVFFRTRGEIFQFGANQIMVHNAPSEWLFLGKTNDGLIAQDARDGFMQFRNGSWVPLNKTQPQGILATAIISYGKDTALLTTSRSGTWLITQETIEPFLLKGADVPESFSSIARIDEQNFAIGSNTGGCFIIDKQGTVSQRFAKGSGLSNSSVISVLRDSHRNLWLGLDNGIDFIAFDNAVKHINPSSLNNGAGYSSMIFNNQLYLALSNGVYTMDLPMMSDYSNSVNTFNRVAHSEGQAWGLSVVNDHLLIGSHEGFFEIKNNTAILVTKETGFWTFSNLGLNNSGETIVAGNYNGISVYGYSNGAFSAKGTVSNFDESARFLAIDKKNTIWASHPYRGVYKIEPSFYGSSVVKLYTQSKGLPSSMNNHVYKIKNRIVVGTEKGVYEYNTAKDVFQLSDYFKPILGQTSIRYIKEDPNGNIWFIHEKDLGVIDFSTLNPVVIYLPELKGKMVSGFEHINPINDNNVLVGAQEGFYHINYEKYRKNDRRINVDIRTVQALGNPDSLLFGGYQQPQLKAPRVDNNNNSFHIEYSSPLFEQHSSLEYSYYLHGFDKAWSEWSKKTEKDYTNLQAGNYRFTVKARNNLGNESPSATYSFTVMPPWYETYWAYTVYGIVVIFTSLYFYKRSQKRFLKQRQEYLEKQRQLQYLHQLELEKSEKEIVKLRNEKLQSQIAHKNSELASTAMHLVQKGEILTKIKAELTKLNKQPGDKEITTNIKKIVKVLNEEDKMNEDWEHFAGHFNNVHSDFLISLKEKYPNLSAHDLKFCAYLRMNLTSKEIAQLMNISIRGVEIGRYRLRKKLQIPTETNLFNFLLNFHVN